MNFNFKTCLDAALSYLNDHQLSPVALCGPDCNCGDAGKVPHTPGWQGHNIEAASEDELIADFQRLRGNVGICAGIASQVSIIDHDSPEAYHYFCNQFALDPQPPTVQSGREEGGWHTYHRLDLNIDTQTVYILNHKYEIKSISGQCAAPPSIHAKSGNPYRWIVPFERSRLRPIPPEFLAAAQKHHVKKAKSQGRAAQTGRRDPNHPVEKYNESGAYLEELCKAGWVIDHVAGDLEYWRRPGKDKGHSATFHIKYRTFWVFSSNAQPFMPQKPYFPFGILALLKFGGETQAHFGQTYRFLCPNKPDAPDDYPTKRTETPPPDDDSNTPQKMTYTRKKVVDDDRIPHLATIAKACWSRKMQADKILIALQLENKKNCDPTLSDTDLKAIVESTRPALHPTRATDIMDADYPEPKWAVPGIIPQGLTLFAGKSKLGKSRLMLSVSVAVALGGKALGVVDVEKGEVLYCALEDGPNRIQDRLDTLCQYGERPEWLYFLTYGELPGMGQGCFDLISAWLKDHPACRMIVIDTLQKIRPTTSGKRNMYEEDYDTIGQIQGIAMRQGIALVCIHHTNKSKPEYVLDEVSGSTGVVGAADTIIILKQTTDGYSLSIIGRDVEAQEKAMRFEDEIWTILGDQAEYQMSEARQQIIDLLAETGEPMSRKEIAQELRKNEWTIRNLLRKMAREKQLVKAGTKYIIHPDDDDDGPRGELL